MHIGILLTRATIWAALMGYLTCVVALVWVPARRRALPRWWRIIWTLACVASVAHFVCAFHFFHDWNHGAAYADTARQTAGRFGLNWGGGIYFNYLFVVLWAVDALWTWAAWEKYHERPRWIGGVVPLRAQLRRVGESPVP